MFKPDLKKYAAKLKALGRNLTTAGTEVHSPVPKAPPLGFVPRVPLHERIREMVRSEQMALLAEQQGKETFAESQYFGPDDDDEFEAFPVGSKEMPTSIRDWGRDIERSKKEQKRLKDAEDRLAKKIGRAVREDNPDFEDEVPVERSPKPPRRKSSSVERSETSDEPQDTSRSETE